MNTVARRFTDEILSDDMAAILRDKSTAERLAIASGMWRFARQLIERTTKTQHPEWTDTELQSHVSRRMSHGTV